MPCKLTPEQLAAKYPRYRMPATAGQTAPVEIRRVRDPNKPRVSIADLGKQRGK